MVMISLSLGRKIKHQGNVLHIVLAALGLALLLAAGLPYPAVAGGEATIVGTLSLAPAFENIGVISSFSGDDNGNNNATLEYREVGSSTWKPGIPMTVDRRDFLYEFPLAGEPDNNPVPNEWKNQWRAVIFGLEPDTEYEVRVTYTDPDGVTGSPVVATIKTRNDNPPSNGNTYYVSNAGDDSSPGNFDAPFRTIQHAASIVNPGDTVLVMPGTYTEEGSGAPWRTGITIDRSGISDNYITFRSYDLDNKAVIDGDLGDGTRLWFGFRLLGSYIRIKGFDLRNFNGDAGGCVVVDNEATGSIIEDNIMIDPGGRWACAGVLLYGSSNTLIQKNQISTTGIGERAQNYGVNFYGTYGGNVIRDNVINTQGIFKDGMGGSGNMRIWGGPGPNSFIYDNYVYGPWDDGLEIEGGNLNVAVWGNFIENNDLTEPGGVGMNMGLGLTSTIVGPLYAFRNVIVNHGDAAIKLGSNSFGNIYLYQNTIYSTGSGAGPSFFGNNAIADNITSRNNIIWLEHGRLCENWDSSGDRGLNSFDYDALWTNREAGGFSWSWYNERYGDLAYFQTTTGQELHAVLVPDPMFVEPGADDFTLQSTSPCIDKGVVLPGFNDADSPWPYYGAAPDLGACESAHGSLQGPLHHIAITPGSASLEFSQTRQFTATGYDRDNNEIIGLSFTWSVINAGAGSIDGNGLFTAGMVEGTYADVVKAEAESIVGYASVSIAGTATSFPWGLFGGILGGVLVTLAVATLLYLVLRRRRIAGAQ